MPKFIIVSGGVISGLGKGILTASIAKILQSHGLSVIPIKIDGYVNVDAGTMSPFEHGECFVTDDGMETDQDIGTYERFLALDLPGTCNMTTGKIFSRVIDKERKGEYLGKTVQIIPHVTDEIKNWIKGVAKGHDVCIVEIGGTIGDIENSYFVEACRQMKAREDLVWIHLTLAPILDVVGEQKTKPTQHSVKMLLEEGVQPDMVVVRSPKPLPKAIKEKISLFCNVPVEAVVSDPDLDFTYALPFLLEEQGLIDYLKQKLDLKLDGRNLDAWKKRLERLRQPLKKARIAVCGKYTGLHDAYISILDSLKHAGAELGVDPEIVWLETTEFDPKSLEGIDGIIVPGGFGSRGVEGKIDAIQYAREKNIPFLGLCYGLQLATIEFARNVCGLKGAHTTEVEEKTPHPVIMILPEQLKTSYKGGTMRLGAYPAVVKEGTLVHNLYGSTKVSERHRHRYEVNPDYIKQLESKGLVFSGKSPDGNLMEFLELPGHKFFVATQAHPEFKSRFEKPAPLFHGFLRACMK